MDSPGPFDHPGCWYRGNLHTHSTVSDGKLSPEEVKEWYRARGYHFIALTEHRRFSAGEQHPGDDFLTLSGIELDGNDPHVGLFHLIGLGGRCAPWKAEQAATSLQEAVDSIRAEGGIAMLAHPYWSGEASKDLLALQGCFGLEMWNGGCEAWDCKGLSTVHWDDLLAAGRRMWGVAADDAHWWEGRADAGLGWVWVKAEALTEGALLGALKAGDFYASSGPEIASVRVEGGQATVKCSPVVAVDFIGDGPLSRRSLAPPGGTITEAAFELKPAYSFGRRTYLRITCRDAQGGCAWSNPIFL